MARFPRRAIFVAFAVLVLPLAGCLGSSGTDQAGDSRSGDSTDVPDNTTPPDREPTDSDEPSNRPDPGANTSRTTRERSVSTNLSVTAQPVINVTVAPWGWDLHDRRPANLSAVLVEVTWSTPTQGTTLGEIYVDAGNDTAVFNHTTRQSGDVRMWVPSTDYTDGKLHLSVQPAGGSGGAERLDVWANAEFTVYATTFYGGVDREFSAIG